MASYPIPIETELQWACREAKRGNGEIQFIERQPIAPSLATICHPRVRSRMKVCVVARERGYTLREIGEMYGVSKARAAQYVMRAQCECRKCGPFFDEVLELATAMLR